MNVENAENFDLEELARIDAANDLKIAPFRTDGVTYGTPTWIWAVVVDDALYVRAYHGTDSRWYQAALAQRAGRIYSAGMVKEVAFESVDDTMQEAIDSAYRLKYKNSAYFPPMVSNRARQATIKIVPRL